MLLSNIIFLLKTVFEFYSRLVCIVLSAALYQAFVIVEIFIHSYTIVYPPYLSKHINRFYSIYSWILGGVVTSFAAKTNMLNKFGRWIIHIAIAILGLFVAPLSYIISIKRNKKCPPPTNPLLFHSATKLSDMIRRRQETIPCLDLATITTLSVLFLTTHTQKQFHILVQITSEEVVTAYVERCKEVNPYLNAIVEPRFEVALREARTIDTMLGTATPENTPERLAKQYPLLGVPITVKESIAVEGMSNDAGCVRATREPAKCDATTVRLARAAGAIPIAVTNTPELCMHWETYNYVTGLTMNPYQQKRTVGGSSGGEAALLSAAGSVIGLGSDIAGSLRLPSMFTGVYGHKPTPRIVSTEGHNPGSTDPEWDDYFALGPMVRYAEDLPLMLRVLSDTRHTQLSLDKQVDIQKIRFCYIEGDTSGVADKIGSDVRRALERVRDHFKDTHNIEVEEVKFKNSEHMWELSSRILLGLKGVGNIYSEPSDVSKWRPVWPELIRKMFGLSEYVLTSVLYGPLCKLNWSLPARQVKKMKIMLEEMKAEFSEVLKGDCVMFYPTYPTQAHVHYQVYYRFLNLSYLTIFNVLGLPVTNCPLGLTSSGLPVGVQVVAAKYNDHLTIAVAKELERAFGGWVPPNASVVSNGKLNFV